MPPLKTCGTQWNVGTDDFTLPALLAVFIRLVSIGLTVGVLIYLFVGPDGCPEREEIPPFVYGSLFFLVAILFLAILNENIIFSISLRGSIVYKEKKRKWLPFWLFVRVALIIIEFLSLIACAIAVFGPAPYAAGALQCPEFHDGPLVFAKVIVMTMLVVIISYSVGFSLYLDPLGLLCSPSLWHDLEKLEKAAENPTEEVDGEILAYAKNSRLGSLHRSHIGYGKIFRKLRGLLCCLNSNGNRSRSTAMHEMALAFHTVFSGDGKVTTDLVAGLILLSQYQKRIRQKCSKEKDMEGFYLHKTFSELTFTYMPDEQKPVDYNRERKEKMRVFNPGDPAEMELLDNLVHYMKYAMGIYGWPLHLFDDPCCGLCDICAMTCCRCNYRRWHPMARATDGDIPRVVEDNCCMSGLGTVMLRSSLPESNVLYISYKNDVFLAPFSICADREKKKIVLTVRGTLSVKDALTDLSVSMEEMEEEDKVSDFRGSQFVHKGMYATAQLIIKEIRDKRLLSREFEKEEFKDYGLVLTGHSLGAGVVSVLSVILKREYEDRDLKCYAFSPPGCIFSFPLAWYSRSFIQSVVLGNDMIPRVTFQSLFYVKWQINNLLQKCRQSKFQVLFRPRFLDRLPQCILNCLCSVPHNHQVDEEDCHKELEKQMKKQVVSRDKPECESGGSKFLKAVQIVKAKGHVQAKAQRRWKRLRKAVFKGNHIHGFVQGMVEGEQIAAFPPGEVLHIHVEYSKKPWLCHGPLNEALSGAKETYYQLRLFHYCYPDQLEMRHVHGEDLAVIIVDRGMIDDHLPNNVLKALQRCQKEALGSVNRSHRRGKASRTYELSNEDRGLEEKHGDEPEEVDGKGGGYERSRGHVPVAVPLEAEDQETELGEQLEMTGDQLASHTVTVEVETELSRI